MPRRMAYWPSPEEFRSTVTPEIFCTILPTVTSGASSMAREPSTLTTLAEKRSISMALASVLPLKLDLMTTSERLRLVSSIRIASTVSA